VRSAKSIRASSERRNAPANPTSSNARSRVPRRLSGQAAISFRISAESSGAFPF
jgi:hypothetical protein